MSDERAAAIEALHAGEDLLYEIAAWSDDVRGGIASADDALEAVDDRLVDVGTGIGQARAQHARLLAEVKRLRQLLLKIDVVLRNPDERSSLNAIVARELIDAALSSSPNKEPSE